MQGGGNTENGAPGHAAGIVGSGTDGQGAGCPRPLCYEPDYDHVDAAIRSHQAAGALLEVSEDGRQDMGYCLALCARLRETAPRCRLMLMCPEGQAETIRRAVDAKRRGEIDDFVFYDVSLDYLAASLQSL